MTTIQTLNNEAHNFRRAREWVPAVDSFSQMLTLAQPNEWWYQLATVCRGLCYRQLNKIDAALADYTACITQTPQPAAYFFRGCAYLAYNNPSAAQTDFRAYLQHLKGDTLLEPVFSYADDLALASKDVERGIATGDLIFYLARGIIRSQQRDYYGAIADLEQAASHADFKDFAKARIASASKAADMVKPSDTQLMLPEMEYAMVVFDGDAGQSRVDYFSIGEHRTENQSGEVRLESKGWKKKGTNSHKEGYTSYYQRSTGRQGVFSRFKFPFSS